MTEPVNRPQSCWDLFMTFTWMALQGFGGVQAVVQRILVDQKKWLTPQGFLEDWSVAQTLPGPHVVNLTLMLVDQIAVHVGRGRHHAAKGDQRQT